MLSHQAEVEKRWIFVVITVQVRIMTEDRRILSLGDVRKVYQRDCLQKCLQVVRKLQEMVQNPRAASNWVNSSDQVRGRSRCWNRKGSNGVKTVA